MTHKRHRRNKNMGYRPRTDESKEYWLPKEQYLTAVHYALQYPEWRRKLRENPQTIKGITYDGDKVQSSGDYDPTSDTAMRRHAISKKMRLVEETAREAAPEIYTYLLRGVTYGHSASLLRLDGMPCSERYYLDCRQKFYYLLSHKI